LLTCTPAGVAISDDQSKNGTFVNGTRLTFSMPLRDGDFVQMGHTLLRFSSPAIAYRALLLERADASVRDLCHPPTGKTICDRRPRARLPRP
jgi:pSer/pThr/pTyr-binding forkhead associated (FHA) protein